MRLRHVRTVLLLCLTFIPVRASGQSSIDRWEPIARALTDRMAIQRGERVLLVGAPGLADSLVPLLRAAIRSAGGEDLGAIGVRAGWPDAWSTDFTRRLSEGTAAAVDALLDEVDLGVMLPGAVVSDALYGALQDKLRDGQGRTIHFHWAGAYGMDGALLPNTAAIDAHYRTVLLQTDYASLATRQREFEAAARGTTIRVTDPAGTDLRFQIEDRPVTRQDGDASARRAEAARNLIDREIELPAGAIRVAPMEESVEGTIAFPTGDWGGERVEGLVMRFENGRLTTFEARTGRGGVERELARGGSAARAFREFALGFNPLLAPREDDGKRWIPYYGYGAGVVRLSLGDNTELGGRVGGGYVRWNFFTETTVTVGDRIWVRGGKLQ
jgi:hypothetical protein